MDIGALYYTNKDWKPRYYLNKQYKEAYYNYYWYDEFNKWGSGWTAIFKPAIDGNYKNYLLDFDNTEYR